MNPQYLFYIIIGVLLLDFVIDKLIDHLNAQHFDDPIPEELNDVYDKEEYKKSTAPSINHFYEKLLLLKDRMNTKTGYKMDVKRHLYMEKFLTQFYEEWNGEK